MSKQLLRVVILILVVTLLGCGVGRMNLYLSDLDPKIDTVSKELGIDVILNDYPKVGVKKHDEFHKSTAIILTTFEVTKWMINDATKNLKRYAQDHLAKMTMDENITELIGDTPHDQITVEQAAAVMKMEKERDNISEDETKYFVTTSVNIGVGILSLTRFGKEVPKLIITGTAMIANVKGDFTFLFVIPKFWRVPGAIKGLKESVNRLKSVKNDAPVLLEDSIVLVEAIRALN